MRAHGLVVIALAGSCYRDSTPPIENGGQPIAMREGQCGHNDDLGYPPLDPEPGGRLRSHAAGVMSGPSGRTWVGPAIPAYVPAKIGTLELTVLDDADGGTLAFYRDPYGLSSCKLGDISNCAYEARFYDDAGKLGWSVRLDQLLSRPDQLEIQDIRLADGVLYFNEACQSYSAEANRDCSKLVAVEPRSKRVLWRTKALVSNGRFLLRGCYVIAGYGFTREADFMHLIDRATGKLVQRLPVSSAPEQLTLNARDRLDVKLYSGSLRRFRLDGFDGGAPNMVALDPPDAYGGASYGGMGYGGYGGASYGGAALPTDSPTKPTPKPNHQPNRTPKPLTVHDMDVP